jgi:hypothetical protein
MGRKYITILTVFLIALASYLALKKNTGKGTLPVDHFQVADTSLLTSIYLSGPNDSVFLEKTNAYWRVNNNALVDLKKLGQLMEVLHKVEVKAPLSGESRERYLPIVKSEGVHVELFAKNEPYHEFFFYENQTDQVNSFMYAPALDALYLVKVTGLSGPLAPYFSTSLNHWQSNILMHFPFHELKTISCKYDDPMGFYSVTKIDSANSFSLFNKEGQPLYSIPQNIRQYFTYFTHIAYEKALTSHQVDDIGPLPKFATLTIEQKNGQEHLFGFYRLPKKNETGFDLNFLIVENINQNRFYKVKYLEIDLLLKNMAYFK